MDPVNEYSVAASYYGFFHRRRKQALKGEEPKLLPKPWKEDSWTSVDEMNCSEILKKHIEKCSISTILTVDETSPHLEIEDANAWDQFYSNHGNRFFKDRHYFEKAFPTEFPPSPAVRPPSTTMGLTTTKSNDCEVQRRTLVEIGCGVGNAILPFLEVGESEGNWDVIHGLDISTEAIQILRKDPRFIAFNETGPSIRKAHGHVCDVSRQLPPLCSGISNVTTLIFCLSAIDPARHMEAAKHVVDSLKPGGVLVFRDYGRYDEAQMKLGTSRSKRIKENFYRKHDGTKCYYFSLEDLEQIFCRNLQMESLELKYLRRVYGNKATTQVRRRVWVQGRFRKSSGKEEENSTN